MSTWNEYGISDRVEVIKDHIRGGRLLAKQGQHGTVMGYDFSIVNITGETWLSVKLDGNIRSRHLPSCDLKKI